MKTIQKEYKIKYKINTNTYYTQYSSSLGVIIYPCLKLRHKRERVERCFDVVVVVGSSSSSSR